MCERGPGLMLGEREQTCSYQSKVSAGMLYCETLSLRSRTSEGNTVSNCFRWSSLAGYLVSMMVVTRVCLRSKEELSWAQEHDKYF